MNTESHPKESAGHIVLILLILGGLIFGGYFILQALGDRSAEIVNEVVEEGSPQFE